VNYTVANDFEGYFSYMRNLSEPCTLILAKMWLLTTKLYCYNQFEWLFKVLHTISRKLYVVSHTALFLLTWKGQLQTFLNAISSVHLSLSQTKVIVGHIIHI